MRLHRTLVISLASLFIPLCANAANPPPGISIPSDVREKLEKNLAELGAAINVLKADNDLAPRSKTLIPDAEIYYNAVRYALVHDQFYRDKKPNEFDVAAKLLETGKRRARLLKNGETPWTRQTGLVVRGYISEVDGSVQPYGLEIPDTYDFDGSDDQRLDIWYHGRGNTLSEIKFLNDRETSPGKFQSPSTIIIHPFGRYCNANKFVGEIDTFEAVESVSERYRIDSKRTAVRGFSMGGAVVWHMATHHAGLWAAAAPGAGFAETAVYADTISKDPQPTWYEQKLYNLYDATQYARNLFHCPTIAYSGSEDKQKQAADIMTEYMLNENLELTHIIGPGMGHKYDSASIEIINDQVQRWASKPIDPYPNEIRFTTYTLRYNKMLWLTVDALDEHWKRSDVTIEVVGEDLLDIKTKNIQAFRIDVPPQIQSTDPIILINGQRVRTFSPISPTGLRLLAFRKYRGLWAPTFPGKQDGLMTKSHGLQGPIDDAFMSRFLFVLPSVKSSSSELDKWVESESKDAIAQWWKQFRGEVRVKRDVDVTPQDIQKGHLILWGDPSSNSILARIHKELPIQWSGSQFTIADKRYSTDEATPVLIYPNPLNPERYIVINSSFTFSEFSGGSNSLQVPKLPDWAIVNLNVARSERHPKGIIDAGFFNEYWQHKTQP